LELGHIQCDGVRPIADDPFELIEMPFFETAGDVND
jgi:hypothetical protein